MSTSYDHESQNNTHLATLSTKVAALRSTTIDIYDHARNQEVIDSNNEVFSNLRDSIRGSAGRLTRAAGQGNRVAVLKLAGVIVGVGLGVWYLFGWVLGGKNGEMGGS